jgi:membrane fusion protein (multidrug efflux system)
MIKSGLVRRGGAALLLAACSKSAPPAAAPPPPEVRVVVVSAQPIAKTIELPGRLQAIRTSEVRARVDGIIERRLYTEGTDVSAGQPLFAIDPRPLRAQVNAAAAALSRAQATAANAEQDIARYKGLVAQQALSQQEYDAATARLRTAQADLAQRRAELVAARLNLSYTTVTAPIAGRAGRAEVTEGALVKGSEGTLLTRIEALDPIYANFSQSSSAVIELRRQIASGDARGRITSAPVHMTLEDGTPYRSVGRVDFFDMSIDSTTGSAAMRAIFPNPQHQLLPGQFVRVRVDAGVRPNGMRLPQRAVTLTPNGGTVFIVGAKDVVAVRPVKLGQLEGDEWVIDSGLTPGERVIVDGVQKVQPGIPVKPVVAK